MTIPENSLFQGPALDWFLNLEGDLKQDWNYLQSELKSKFSVPSLSIVQKFQVRQSILMQWPKERVQDFVERLELVSKELNHFGVIAGLFRHIGGHRSRFVLFCSFLKT